VHVAQPAFYLISVLKDGKREDEMVDPHTMRDRVKQGIETGSEVWCHGIIMPKAGGDEVKELMQNGTLTEPEKKNLINSMLQTIKGLNERGFVHHDIKPDNCYFDKETKTTTLIDTGSLYKTREGREKHGGQYIRDVKVGTPGYWHPRVDRQEEHGTETDLYALGVVALQLDHPTAYSHLVSAISKQMSEPGGVTEDWALKWLEQEIGRTQKEDLKNDLIALRDDLLKEDPKSLSGFAIECFAQAGLPAEDWSGRTYAQKAYSKLLEHSGIQ
jgi:serine/threonine protein kinase